MTYTGSEEALICLLNSWIVPKQFLYTRHAGWQHNMANLVFQEELEDLCTYCEVHHDGAHLSKQWAGEGYTQLSCHTISQCASSPDNRVHFYTELAISSPAVAETIASTHCTYPQRDGQAEWALVAWINTGMVGPPKVVTNPSTNRARRSSTSLAWQTPWPWRQTSRHNPSEYRCHNSATLTWSWGMRVVYCADNVRSCC